VIGGIPVKYVTPVKISKTQPDSNELPYLFFRITPRLILPGVLCFPLCCMFISEELFRDLLGPNRYISGKSEGVIISYR
jgi:hypothetical protein